ncbi:MAG: family 10 glycosylhydrolase [Cyanobacteria bacterium]|nr:family 10 glycosylhydrolase [Cyanobacteria bacterium CG_2015-16_32_12]NCO79128.1 family 10 glycosylhydrolase [Cyanobacteria bacterium CG_2015-22_32_23]NCQ05237.1 family 10 glycosylhydrolase [Cyanobacteria bacterium CG_2015-09_32_10]NCQ42460.1 family 10 glycosylhydrolase [Cyanobacteria bacterium CG_2015-04_32_10]NCS86024.1 family 10 glycosylhydrolase [Cyanobacteria bacterium CG_2015-02_32_10]
MTHFFTLPQININKIEKTIILFLVSVFFIVFLHPQQVISQSSFPEIRGVWLTKNDTDILLDRSGLENSLRELADLNFNTIYPVVWNSGYVSYPSEVAERVGIPPLVRSSEHNKNVIGDIVEEGHLKGLLVIPWFEFGFMTPPSSELAIKNPRWITNRRDGSKIGESAGGSVVWLNPFHPQVQQFIMDLVLEIITKYPVDGIQFDDHTVLPRDFGYDPYTVALYKQETKKDPPANFKNADWVKWRADKITDFMVRLNKAVKERKPSAIFSVAPNPYHTAYNIFLQDWHKWVNLGIVDELIIQVYRPDLKAFVKELNTPQIQSARQKIPTGVAILTGLRNKPTPITLIEDKVRQARRYRLGVAFFYYETLWENTTTESDDLRKAVVRALFFNPQRRN